MNSTVLRVLPIARPRSVVLGLGLGLLFLAHGLALLYRVQPSVSLWFPPSGVAIALTIWFGPIGALLTAIASVTMAPLWGSDGWLRWVGLTDMAEPLVAWWLYRQCFRRSLGLNDLGSAIVFLLSAPVAACLTSAALGCWTLAVFNQIPASTINETIAHWWVGNALGTMTVTPVALLLLTPILQRWGWLRANAGEVSSISEIYPLHRGNWLEIAVILAAVVCLAGLSVQATQDSIFTVLQFSFLSAVPIIWAAIRCGAKGGVLTASFSIIITLLSYLVFYPNAINLSHFPVEAALLHTHKLSLLWQGAIALLVGMAVVERLEAQTSLVAEQVRRCEYQTRAQLSEKLLRLNRLLSETNQQLHEREEELYRHKQELTTLVESSPDIIARFDRQLRHLYINPAIEAVTGIPQAAFMGKTCSELPLPVEFSRFWQSLIEQVVATEEPQSVEFTFVTPDGMTRYYQTRQVPERSRQGEIESVMAITRDITDLKQTEVNLREKEALLRTVLENFPNGGVFVFNRDLRYILAEGTGLAAVGLDRSDLEGKTIWQALPAETCAILEPIYRKALSGVTERLEIPFANHLYDCHALPLLSQGEEISLGMIITQDITERKRTESQLQQRQHFIERITETVPGILYVYDLIEWRNIYTNSQLTEILGYAPETIQTMGNTFFSQLMHPDDLARLPDQIERIRELPDGEILEFEFRMRHANGQWHWLGDRMTVFTRTPEGLPHQILGCAQDISERKQAQIALQQANERFQLAAAAVKGTIYDLDVQTGRIERTEGLLELLGYIPDEVPPTCEWWREQIHPDDLPNLPATIADETPNLNGRRTQEYRIRHQDGHYVYVADQCLILRDRAGNPVRAVGSTTDISARKLAEEAQQRSEARSRQLVDSNLIGILFTRFDGCIPEANAAFLTMVGYTSQELEAGLLNWRRMTPPEYTEHDEQAIAQIRTTGACVPYEKEYWTKAGSRLPILIGAARLDETENECVCFVLDLTERKRIERERANLLVRERMARQQAEAASRMKDEFLAIVSHELRSPLNGILGWSRLLRSRQLDPDTTEKALASIERNAQAQTQLIEDLLDISRIIRGKVRLKLHPVNPLPIVQSALDTIRPTAAAKSIDLIAQLDPEAGLVSGDLERLQQVVWNLLSNAVKFTPEGGRVELRLEQVDSHVRIQVTDTGKGIAPDFLPYVFERFRQADATTTRNYGGLGLGLAIVRHLVELHGGTVQASSEGEGQGAMFRVDLPLLSAENQAIATSRSQLPLRPDPASLQGLQVLVVDDEADTRDFLLTALKQFGATVTAVASAQEAFVLFEQHQPDVLLCDIGMPEEDGYALIRRIRALSAEAGGKVPAAALTAYVRGDDRRQALAAGFNLHVSKPIEPLQLLNVVAQLAGEW